MKFRRAAFYYFISHLGAWEIDLMEKVRTRTYLSACFCGLTKTKCAIVCAACDVSGVGGRAGAAGRVQFLSRRGRPHLIKGSQPAETLFYYSLGVRSHLCAPDVDDYSEKGKSVSCSRGN